MSQATVQYSEQTVAWVRSLYEKANSNQDRKVLLAILTDNAEIRFNGHTYNKANLEKLIAWQYDVVESITYVDSAGGYQSQHAIISVTVAVSNNKIFVHTKQTYVLKDGKEYKINVCTIFHKAPADHKVSALYVYADVHDVFKDVEKQQGHAFSV